MSTVVCQGLQPCPEPQVLETTLRLKLAAPKSLDFGRGHCLLDTDSQNVREMACRYEDVNKMASEAGEKHLSSNLDFEGWSFLQVLSNISQGPKEEEDRENSYVHPLVKRSSPSRLSQKSLELCTENLGSETGTDISEESIFSASFSDSSSEKLPRKDQMQRLLRPQMESKKVDPRTFPPPLTTISGSHSLRVRPHREGGRLVIRAVEFPSTDAYLQAERSNGRLRLSFLKNYASNFDSEETTEENGAGNKEDEIDPYESDSSDGDEQEDDREESQEVVDEENSDVYRNKDMDGNSFDIEVEMGMDKFQRPSRCKEGGHGNKGLCNWEHLWVASS